ncbi:metallophosphoesterase family protein [Sphingobium sp. AN641]|uniref:metallophosphoesterase family protein n=1 Tax=Sphingobium sp. AN641 TaxID=3133443 RepID=UPI0030C3CB9E
MVGWFRRVRNEAAPPSIGDDRLVYAIGDIHGRADLLGQLLDLIAQDVAGRPRLPIHLVLLGDLVDRGPHSAQVVTHAISLSQAGSHVHILKGNHEEVFVLAARGDPRAARTLRRIGGIATLESYGLAADGGAAMDDDEIAGWLLNHVPRAHVDFLDGLPDRLEMRDYLFVHAGVRPHVPLADQDPADLRWIRQEFLNHGRSFGPMVVHGHSITDDVDERANRIGIDTGAWSSGRLTALGLHGADRWTLQTGG